jgi:hypothetical protein
VTVLPPPSPFDHALHSGAAEGAAAKLAPMGGAPACVACHPVRDPTTGKLARPGSDEHAPCDRCHRDAFFQPPGPFCRTCHVEVEPRAHAPDKNPSRMQPWPPERPERRRPSLFDHRRHLDKTLMERRFGHHIGCTDCHLRPAGEERATLAGHAACAPCHAEGRDRAGQPLKVKLDQCEKCHVSDATVVPEGRRFITGDLKFSHARHERDLAGEAIACATCHGAVAEAPDVESIALPAMVDCATCHENGKRTPPTARIGNCSVCHTRINAGTAPRNHLGGRAPDDHTILFRTDHAEAARSPEARCRFCHGGVSAARRDGCFECHTVMKPRDHSLRWATFDHGPEAAADRRRCATCHEVDYCARCHSQRPRSHTPFDSFVNGGHSTEARLNLRVCMACHTFDESCARCHGGEAFPGGRP